MEKTGKRLDFLAGTPKPQDVVLKPALPSFPRPGSQEFAVENKDASHIAVAGYSPNDGETGSHSVVASSEKVQIQNISSGDVTKVLPLNVIDPPTISQRHEYPREMVDRMATSIRRQAHGKPDILDGQINPIIVVPHPLVDGRFLIVDGFTRFQAFTDQFLSDFIKATIRYGMSQAEIFAMAYSANVDRNGTSDFDRGMALASAIKEGIYKDQKDAASALGIDTAAITGLLAFARFPQSIVDVIKTAPEKFSYNVAARLQAFSNKNAPEDQLIYATRKLADGTLTFKKLNQLVTNFSGTTPRNVRKKRRDTRNILGFGKVRATESSVTLDLESLPADVAPKLAELVEQTVTAFLKNHVPSESFQPSATDHDNQEQ
jgi:ParB/RepB/Spo0J family partition protein